MALSPEITALIPLAVEVILIAFRVGNLARTTARYVEVAATQGGADSWSHAIADMTEAEALSILASFHQEKVTQGRLPFTYTRLTVPIR